VIIPSGVPEPPSLRNPLLSPRAMPDMLAIFMIGLGAVIAALGLSGRHFTYERLEGSVVRGLAMAFGGIAVYLLLVNTLGAFLVAVLVTAALLAIQGERNWVVYLFAAVVTPAVAVGLLTRVASVPLPTGLLGF
jgi:hypothetical protein